MSETNTSVTSSNGQVNNHWTLALQTHTVCGTNSYDQVPVYSDKTGLLSIVTDQATISFRQCDLIFFIVSKKELGGSNLTFSKNPDN